MIFKILGKSTTWHGIDYNDKKQKQGKASMIGIRNFGHLQDGKFLGSSSDIKKYLTRFSSVNTRTKHKQFHAILSSKGKSETHEDLREHAFTILKELGYENNPVVIYAHTDTPNNHIHIITTRINEKGHKIRHGFENKRANAILNRLNGLNPKLDFEKNYKEISRYAISSVAQFQLLFELKGYQTQKNAGQIQFYKHGTKQGEVSISEINNQIVFAKTKPLKKGQLKALIHKYKNQYSTLLQWDNKSATYTTKKPVLETALTNFLMQQFGYEFIFFSGKDNPGRVNDAVIQPYGYLVIDHKNHAVYKGGEVMKLEALISTGIAGSPEKIKPLAGTEINNNKNFFSKAPDSNLFESNTPGDTNKILNHIPLTDLEKTRDHIAEDMQEQIKQADYNNHVSKRKKRKFT